MDGVIIAGLFFDAGTTSSPVLLEVGPSGSSACHTANQVSNNVTSHEAWGMGIYSVFTNPGIFLTRAIEAPVNANVRFHNVITVCIGPTAASATSSTTRAVPRSPT